MHLDDERLQRLTDGEMSPAERAAALEHLASCAACARMRLEAENEERRTQDLLRELDMPAPALDVETVVAVAADRTAPARLHDPARGFERRPARLRWAAAAAFAAALAGAAFALPGSPVPRLLREVVARLRHPAPPPETAPGEPNVAGIAITPGERLMIELQPRGQEGLVTVRLIEGAKLSIRAPSGGATFTSDVDRVQVQHPGGAIDIDVPRGAPLVEVQVDGVPRFRKEGSRVTLAEPLGYGTWRIPLASR